ncbi:MAG: ComEC/Rec2 family competence protein [Deltaproteobacteria bacterium]|nr:ComEC/Rec2 family competence protein [Deltaproteobacteria bacterium]
MRRPLLLVAIPFLAGTLAWTRLVVPWDQAVAGGTLCLCLALLAPRVGRPAVLAGALLLGVAVPGTLPDGPALLGPIRLRGTVAAASGTRAWVSLEAVAEEAGAWRPARGRVQAVLHEGAPPPGTRLVALGSALPAGGEALPGEPDPVVAARLARVATTVSVRRWVAVGRLPPPGPTFEGRRHAALLRALVVADRSAVPEDTLTLFRRTGTSHLLSISGMNLVLVAAPVGFGVARIARLLALVRGRSHSAWVGALAATVAVIAYGGVARWPVSATRAAAMVAAGGIATALERDRDPWNLLAGAAMVLACLDPGSMATAGWQLSFGAIAGLLLVGPRIARCLPPDLPRPVRWISEAGIATLSATCGTLPVTAWWFQELALGCLPANLVAVPLVGAVATPGALLGAVLPAPLGPVALFVADLAMEATVRWLSLLDAAPIHPAVGPAGALLLVGALLLRRRPGAAAVLALAALWLRIVPCGRLVVTVLSVGQGTSALVEWPDGRRWLVDGGPGRTAVARYLRRRGITRLEALVCSHGHPDHTGGLPEVIETFRVDRLWLPHLPGPGDPALGDLVKRALGRGIPIGLPGDPGLPVVWPEGPERRVEDANEGSLVLRVAYGRRAVLLPGDASHDAEQVYARTLDPVDLVVVPHHGSRTASSPALVRAAQPRLVVVPCGQGNRFGHPHPEARAAWRGALFLRTDLDGTVEVSTDGRDLDVRTWRPGEGWRQVALGSRPGADQEASTGGSAWEGAWGGSSPGDAGEAASSGSSASLASSRKR